MNWKEEAVEKLRKYDAMRQAEQNLPQEITRLEEAAGALRSAGFDASVATSNRRGQEDALLNNMVQRQELQLALQLRLNGFLSLVEILLGNIAEEGQLIAVLVQHTDDLVGVNIVAAPGFFATNSIVQRYMGSNKNGAVITIGNFLFKICRQCINSCRNCTFCIAAIVGIALFPREVILVDNKDTKMLRVIGTKGVQTNGVIRIVVTLNIDNLIVSSVVIEVGC